MSGKTYEAAFMIADLAGYTALTEIHGDHAAADLVGHFTGMVETALATGASLEQSIGDEVLLKAPDSEPLLKTAVALARAVDQALNFPCLHIGMHVGPVLERNGHYFGNTLNLTSRIAAHSAGGQILCSGLFRSKLAYPEMWEFRSLGPVRFKNYSEAIEVLEVLTDAGGWVRVFDPVCRMRIDPGSAPARLPYGDKIYHFCSLDCARRFMENPQQFAAEEG